MKFREAYAAVELSASFSDSGALPIADHSREALTSLHFCSLRVFLSFLRRLRLETLETLFSRSSPCPSTFAPRHTSLPGPFFTLRFTDMRPLSRSPPFVVLFSPLRKAFALHSGRSEPLKKLRPCLVTAVLDNKMRLAPLLTARPNSKVGFQNISLIRR